jgi:uncharacterized membrane protein YqgA involved in biofilm formation
MIGPYVNGTALLIGSMVGGFIGPKFSKDFRLHMPMVFGCTSIGISIAMIIKAKFLAPVALAVILGTIFGEIIHLENGIQRGVSYATKLINTSTKSAEDRDHQEFLDKFVPLTVLFCFSGMGIYGSLQEGMTGDPTLLIIKSILDIFTSLIFASTIGYSLGILVIPQFLVQSMLFCGAVLIVPYTSPEMLGDFSACGGIILLAIGLRICGIKNLPVANMIPALIIVMPLSWVWAVYFS